MDDIYLMPIGSKESLVHMNDTLINPVSKDLIKEHLTNDEFSALNEIYKDSDIFVWGLEPGTNNKRAWDQFVSEDVVIFVPANDNLIVTRIKSTLRNVELAKKLWGVSSKSGQTWELIFFVKIVSILQLDKRTLLTELGYGEKDVLMGNRKVTERFFDSFTSLSNFINSYSGSEVTLETFSQESTDRLIDNTLSKHERLETLKQRLDETSRTTEFVELKGRRVKRNHLLVKFIKEKADYKCQACGFTFIKKDGSRYVEVAHIRPLARSREDTSSNVVALCPNCHRKLDHGNDEAREEVLKSLGEAS